MVPHAPAYDSSRVRSAIIATLSVAVVSAGCHHHAMALVRCEEQPDREPVLLADALPIVVDGIRMAARAAIPGAVPAAGTATTCGRCACAAYRHRTAGGHWILVEPGEWPVAAVPAGRRWRVARDGTAVNLRASVSFGTCRISHFEVCPAGPPPAASPLLLGQWRSNARRRLN